jgi:hypothetical protein
MKTSEMSSRNLFTGIHSTKVNSHFYAFPIRLAPTTRLLHASDIMYFIDLYSLRVVAVIHDIGIWTAKAKAGQEIFFKAKTIEQYFTHRYWLSIIIFLERLCFKEQDEEVTIYADLGEQAQTLKLLTDQLDLIDVTIRNDDAASITNSPIIVEFLKGSKQSFKANADMLTWDRQTGKLKKFQDIISIRNQYLTEHNASHFNASPHFGRSPDELYFEQNKIESPPTLISTGEYFTQIFKSKYS